MRMAPGSFIQPPTFTKGHEGPGHSYCQNKTDLGLGETPGIEDEWLFQLERGGGHGFSPSLVREARNPACLAAALVGREAEVTTAFVPSAWHREEPPASLHPGPEFQPSWLAGVKGREGPTDSTSEQGGARNCLH